MVGLVKEAAITVMCKVAKPPKQLRILSFNVEGLKPKLDDPSFLKFIQGFDISILSETWKADTTKINIENFWDFSQVRPKHEKAIRHSGGITILAKHDIRPGIRLVENSEGFLWIRLEKSFFKLENDIFLCGAYIPPKNTTQNISKTDYFGKLEKSILEYKGKGNILIMGDLNARTGNKGNAKFAYDKHLSNLLPDVSKDWNTIEVRSSCDDKVNTSGRTLLNICNNHNLRIANGQTPGDRVGNYTCFNHGGASVVDYFITENTLQEKVLAFKVLPPEFDSKHAPIAATIKTETSNKGKGKLLNPPKAYNWDSQCSKRFIDLMNQKESQIMLGNFSKSLKDYNTVENLQNVTKSFTQFMNNCADKSLKLKNRFKKNKKHNKPWYNESCIVKKRQFRQLAKSLQKHPKNPFVIGQYEKAKKSYKSTIKNLKRKWEEENIRTLETLTKNPTLFWKHLKSLRGKIKSSPADTIPPDKWIEHFSNLFNKTELEYEKEGHNPKVYAKNDSIPILDSVFYSRGNLKRHS